MIQEFKKIWKPGIIGLLWFLVLLWPMTGINSDGTLSFAKPFEIWFGVVAAAVVIMVVYSANKGGMLQPITGPVGELRDRTVTRARQLPLWIWIGLICGFALFYPAIFSSRPAHDLAINVLIYISLGLGLNVVIGLAITLFLTYLTVKCR